MDSADVVAADMTDPRGGPLVLLSNEDVAIAISRRRQAMPYLLSQHRRRLTVFCTSGFRRLRHRVRSAFLRARRLPAAAKGNHVPADAE
jgi:hypothetical protein